ncbi:MAG: anaerobic ribonucleoside-triphosphate reductase activating protein [Candidatus Thermoplasmatota archaeon]|nr:anaerobic ribonucleoside-triphosphate reductase activating protein [Candidatus Thermoplasmatota archaeon]
MIPIKALQKLSLIDYPGKLCATLFLGGCNFRCPYCYNIDLVLKPDRLRNLSEQDIFNFLVSRKKLIDGVCLGGGEPTVHEGLLELVTKLKTFGFAVKLDTNGSMPNILRDLIKRRIVDYIAMDVKAPLEKYSKVVGVEIDTDKLKGSIALIKSSGIDYEFRITLVPTITEREDLIAIAQMLRNSKKFVLQQFDNKRTLNKKFQNVAPYPRAVIEDFAQAIKHYFGEVKLRV